MLGLIVYGITQGKWSLRELERLARMDLGAMWMSGRVQPDHSTIGKFIQLHEQILSEQFFTALVKQLVRKLPLSAGTVGLDGTVIAAAASHYRMLRAEALRAAALSEQAERMLAARQAAGSWPTALVRRRCSRRKSPRRWCSRPSMGPYAQATNRRRCATKVGW
jgi:hypothetical protein